MDPATLHRTDLAAASPGRTITFNNPVTLPTAGLAQATTFRATANFSVGTGFLAGDTVVLGAGTVATPAPSPRVNAAASVTCAPDTTRPTATLTPVIGSPTFYAVFSEPMAAANPSYR